jgi:outer membrane protein assembly factor BamB
MKIKTISIVSSIAVLAILLAGCATGLTASSWPGMTADKDYAFIAGGSFVYAVNRQTGVEAWRFPAKASAANPFFARPQLTPDGQQLIVGGFDKKLYSLNPLNGAEIWRFEQAKDRWVGGALVTADGIYAANADYKVYALTFSGAAKWAAPFQADQSIWGSPVTDNTNIYFGTLGRKVYAVDLQTGKQVWVKELNGAIFGSPALAPDNKSIFVGTFDKQLVSLSINDGSILSTQTVSSWIWEGPAVDDQYVYVGDAAGMLYAFPLSANGKPWTQQLNGTIIATPLVIDGTLTVGTESGNLYFMDTSGQNLRSITVPGKVYSTVANAGDMLLVAPTGGDSLLLGVDLNGTTKWSFIPAK